MEFNHPEELSLDGYNPDHQSKPPEINYFRDLFQFARRAIDYYNETHLNDDYFVMVDPLALREFRTNNWRDGYIHHLSFVARSIRYSHHKLFFTEFAHCEPQICTIVDPGNPLVRTRCDACHPDSVIYHPPYDSKSRASACFRQLCSDDAYAKKYLRDVYTITSAVEELDSDDAHELQKKYEVYAREALKKFNRKNDARYELVGLVACNHFVCKDLLDWGTHWAHLTFMAKVKDGDRIESSSVLFFAEVGFSCYVYVKTCVIIPTGDDSSIPLSRNGSCCAACRDIGPMLHPERARNSENNYIAGYKGGVFADSMYEGRFRAVKSKVLMKDDDASRATRKEYYSYLRSRGADTVNLQHLHSDALTQDIKWGDLFPAAEDSRSKLEVLRGLSAEERTFKAPEIGAFRLPSQEETSCTQESSSHRMSTASKSVQGFSLKQLENFVGKAITSKPPIKPKREVDEGTSVGLRLKKRKSDEKEVVEVGAFEEMDVEDIKKKFFAVASDARSFLAFLDY